MIINGIALARRRHAAGKHRHANGKPQFSRDKALQGIDRALLSLMYIMDRVQCSNDKALSRQRMQCTSAVYIVGSVGGGGVR